MSENLGLVRSIYESVERGDFGATEWAHPEIEHVQVDGVEPGSNVGLAHMEEHMRTVFADVEDFRTEAEEYRELDGERVLVLTQWNGRGKKSGIPVSMRCAEVFEIHRGKVTRISVYNDRDRALADLGLEE